MSEHIMNNYILKAAGSENTVFARAIVTIDNGVMCKSIILLLIGSMANTVTGYCFVGISFLVNMKQCFDIIRLHKRPIGDTNESENRKRKEELMMKLMLNETAEFLTPIAHMIAVSIAYYGPNADIMGNIKNDYWEYESIDSLSSYLESLLYMTLIDTLSGVMSIILLWSFCRIDGLKFVMETIGKFALLFLFCITRDINAVSNFINDFMSNKSL